MLRIQGEIAEPQDWGLVSFVKNMAPNLESDETSPHTWSWRIGTSTLIKASPRAIEHRNNYFSGPGVPEIMRAGGWKDCFSILTL